MRLTPGRLMLAGLGALVLGLIARRLFVPLALAALILFALGYALLMVHRGRGGRQHPPRPPARRGGPVSPVSREGNVIEFRDSWRNRLRRWLGRR